MFPRCVYSGAFPDFLEYELGSIHISTNSCSLYIHVSILSICFIYTPCISIVLWHSHISVLRYLFLHTSRFYFYILVHFLLYDSGSINLYLYINIILWHSHITVLQYLFYTLHVPTFLFCCISCCTILGPSISCSCVECLPLRVSDQIRTDDHMMIKRQYMIYDHFCIAR